ncbi:DUF6867 family protein [Azospirillum thermophilum]|uniref:DUF6867 domain-containing protein n=1 Tax=Azospirillum thermophilum TaxID=2202148 RepID=A0A2S2CZZ7_9PROT|nr:hypothetical protein [Azospirillum thermophilum]AWK90083.1 hypothetical protein DEW08_29300 [Azospirillum thermophilum]
METLLGSSLAELIGLTVVVFGGCGILTGQTLAEGWKPAWVAVAYSVLLGLGDRFLMFGLFGEPLLSPAGFLVNTLIIGAITLTAYRMAIARRMVQQYPWLYEPAGPFAWRERSPARG